MAGQATLKCARVHWLGYIPHTPSTHRNPQTNSMMPLPLLCRVPTVQWGQVHMLVTCPPLPYITGLFQALDFGSPTSSCYCNRYTCRHRCAQAQCQQEADHRKVPCHSTVGAVGNQGTSSRSWVSSSSPGLPHSCGQLCS